MNFNHVATLLLVGLYGQGKTTTTAKLAEWYRKKHGLRVAVIEADVHRPGAYAQLSQLLEESSVIVYGEPDEKDAATIVRNGLAGLLFCRFGHCRYCRTSPTGR